MWSLICLYLLVAIAGQVHGIELIVSAMIPLTPDDSLPCGKVRCVQEVNKPNNESIISLTLRKQLNGDVLLVEVSQQQPIYSSHNDDYSSHRTRTSGRWEPDKAEAEFSLYDSQDCNNAAFICDVILLDKFGLQHVSNSSGRINGTRSNVTQDCKAQSGEQKTPLVSKVTRAAGECDASITNANITNANITNANITNANITNANITNAIITNIVAALESKVDKLITPVIQIEARQRLTTCSRSGITMQTYQVVYPSDGSHPYLCDTSGGWIVIQRRINGDVNFYRNWNYYKRGFGSFDGDFWLGLDQIHKISFSATHELYINVLYKRKTRWGYIPKKRWAHYDTFNVWSEKENYRLVIGAYTGNAGDSLRYHNYRLFSTYDKDNDNSTRHCAKTFPAGWWFNNCINANLNGVWNWDKYKGPQWKSIGSKGKPLSMTEMKIRKK